MYILFILAQKCDQTTRLDASKPLLLAKSNKAIKANRQNLRHIREDMHTQFLKKKVKGTDHSVGLGMGVTINKEGLY